MGQKMMLTILTINFNKFLIPCGERKVYGMEQLLIMDLLIIK
jgi:hypothetical protein